MGRSILFLVSGLGVGGAELHTLALRAGLQAAGFRTTLVAYGRRRSQAMVGRPGAEGAIQLDIRGMSSLRGWWRIWRTLRRVRPDIVVGVNQAPLIVAVIARLLMATRARIACIYHTTLLRPGDEAAQVAFARAVKQADALIYVSQRQASYWRERGLTCRNEAVIQNSIDLQRFAPDEAGRVAMRAQLAIMPDEFVIGVVASLWSEKNHLQLVEAVQILRARGLPARGVFVGDGPMRNAIAGRIAALGLESAIALVGDVEDVRPYIHAFDVGALPSVAVETFSLAALECLGCGVPMAMSDIGGASEIVKDGVNGRLVAAGDLPALVACLSAMADPVCRGSMAATARASVQRFSRESMIASYRATFEALAR